MGALHELSVLARRVKTTLRSPSRSAKSSMRTAALRERGKEYHVVGGATYALRRAMARWVGDQRLFIDVDSEPHCRNKRHRRHSNFRANDFDMRFLGPFQMSLGLKSRLSISSTELRIFRLRGELVRLTCSGEVDIAASVLC